MPHYLSLGVTRREFMHSSPRTLKAYDKAHELKIKEIDMFTWRICREYVLPAVYFAVEHNLHGKKAKSVYPKKPMLDNAVNNGQMSEKELKLQRELFVAKFEAMKVNFELGKKNGTN